MTSRLAEFSRALTESLQLAQPPVAVAFADAVPDGVPAYAGSAPAGCRFWQDAATGVFATVGAQHDLCAIGIYTHNLEGTPGYNADLTDALKVFGDLGYVREEDLPQIPVLNRQPKVVIYGPLAAMPVAPEVVLLLARADQTLILSEASQQVEGGLPPAMGRPACAVIPQAVNTGRTAYSLGCCGARAYLDVLTPEVALYAIPAARLEAFTQRVAELAKANAVLTQFHTLRRKAVEGGAHPSVRESLHALSAEA